MRARSRLFVHRAAAVRRVALGVVVPLATVGLGACGSDDDVGDTLPPISVTSTTAVTATVPPTVPATAPPTIAPTVAPTQPPPTLPPTSTTSTTSPTTTVAVTTTTVSARAASLVLRDNGLGDALFGVDADEVVAYVRSILGTPTADTGWADPFSAFGVCPGTEVRGVTWNDLTLLFSDSSVVTSGHRHFFSYSYGPAFGSTIDPAGPKTATGISVGSTVAELKAAYPGVVVTPADDIFESNFYVKDTLTGFLTGATDADTVLSITGGIGCGE